MKTHYGRNYLIKALLSLLASGKKYEEITILDLVRKAGVNRSTFYRHFRKVGDVSKAYFSDLMEEAIQRACPHPMARAFYHCLAEVYYEHKEELVSSHVYPLENVVSNVYWDYLFNIEDPSYWLSFYAGGMNLVFLNWYHFEFKDELNVFEKNIDEMIVHDYPIEIFQNRKKKPITE